MTLAKTIIKFPIIIILAILQIFTKLNRRLKLEYIRRFRHDIINIFAENIVKPSSTKVLIVVTHVVSTEEAKSLVTGKVKIERLYNTINGIQKSFAHCDTKIIINTIPEQHIIQFLPQHLEKSFIVDTTTLSSNEDSALELFFDVFRMLIKLVYYFAC